MAKLKYEDYKRAKEDYTFHGTLAIAVNDTGEYGDKEAWE